MRTQLAWHNLLHNKVKSAVALAGVVFAIVLMFMQLGFLEAVKSSATLIYDVLEFDLCIRSKDYLHLADARTMPRQRLAQAGGIPGVRAVVPVVVASNPWRNPQNGQRRAILCLGVTPGEPTFLDPTIQTLVDQSLARPDALLVDTKTRAEFGPANGRSFNSRDVGTEVELNGEKMLIAGTYTLGAGLSAGGAAILNATALQQIAATLQSDRVSLGLITLEPSADPQRVAEELRGVLNQDVDLLTRKQVIRDELTHWIDETNYGLIFQAGVFVSLIVGIAIVYQVLASDVASLLPEYATMKAMGYSDRQLALVLLQQSLLLAVVGYLLAAVIALVLYGVTTTGAGIPVAMTGQNLLLVFVLAVVMCVSSGLAALRKVFQADPADLF